LTTWTVEHTHHKHRQQKNTQGAGSARRLGLCGNTPCRGTTPGDNTVAPGHSHPTTAKTDVPYPGNEGKEPTVYYRAWDLAHYWGARAVSRSRQPVRACSIVSQRSKTSVTKVAQDPQDTDMQVRQSRCVPFSGPLPLPSEQCYRWMPSACLGLLGHYVVNHVDQAQSPQHRQGGGCLEEVHPPLRLTDCKQQERSVSVNFLQLSERLLPWGALAG